MVVVIDNYDSFVYNLVQYLGDLGETIQVYRNDVVSISAIEKLDPAAIVISPGPGRPSDAGISNQVVQQFAGRVPILGVCLGHQCIGEVFGGQIVQAPILMHGKVSLIHHRGQDIYSNMPNPFVATRYHSLIIQKDSVPSCLIVTAWTKEGDIMAVQHRKYPIFGMQFHPESILTEGGITLLKNFVALKECFERETWQIPS